MQVEWEFGKWLERLSRESRRVTFELLKKHAQDVLDGYAEEGIK